MKTDRHVPLLCISEALGAYIDDITATWKVWSQKLAEEYPFMESFTYPHT
jgi:hypothetical protein